MADDQAFPDLTFPARDVEEAQRRARGQQERFLIESVMREEMTPAEADALAAGLGVTFEGQHWPVSMDDAYWPLAFAIIWMAWRSPERVFRQWDRFRAWAGRIWRDPRHDVQAESLQDAEAQLWRALEAGKVCAIGFPLQETDAVEIPAVHWRNLQWMPDQKLICVRNFGQVEARYRCVDVKSVDILSIWPMPGEQMSKTADETLGQLEWQKDPAPTRRGGRPPAWDWDAMWIEVVRLMRDGEVPSRANLPKHLAAWFQATTGDEPASSTLRDKVKKLFDALGID